MKRFIAYILFGVLLIGAYVLGMVIGHERGWSQGLLASEEHWVNVIKSKTDDLQELQQQLIFAEVRLSRLIKNSTWTCMASWYGDREHGRRTASGEIFSRDAFSAAHKKLPFGTLVYIENTDNGQWCIAKINDRGPYIYPREIDVSEALAEALGMKEQGCAVVKVRIL